MAKKDEIISIPLSPGASTTNSDRSGAPTSASSSDSVLSDSPLTDDRRDRHRSLLKSQPREFKDRFRRCREKTLESELCRTIGRFFKNCMSDDQSRRIIAIIIIILAFIGLWHILVSIF